MLVTLVEFVLRLDGFIYAPFYALFLVGTVCRFIDLKRNAPKAEIKLAAEGLAEAIFAAIKQFVKKLCKQELLLY